MKQARLADPRVADCGDDLSMTGAGELECVFELRHLGVAPDELRKASLRRGLQARAQRPRAGDFIDVDKIAQSLYARRAERLQFEVSFNQVPGIFRDRD